MIANAFTLAFRQIRRNYLRAFLTMLGIIIGTGSVIVMITLGNGMSKNIKDNFSKLGNNLVTIHPSRGMDTTGASLKRYFNIHEVELLSDRIYGVNAIAPISTTSSLIKYQQNSRESETMGVNNDYFSVANWNIANGRIFLDSEYNSGANVCIIGNSVKNELFKNSDGLGEKIKVGSRDGSVICEIVGVLEEKGQDGMRDQDDIVLFPLKAYLRTLGKERQSINNITQIMISLNEGVDSIKAGNEIKQVLRESRGIDKGKVDNFEIRDTKQFEEAMTSSMRNLAIFVSAIASVSLIVGGIGIMNIMLVSVTERTKEIGTRLAIGALAHEVLLQFLIEAVVVSSLGGLIGIILAFIISLIIAIMIGIPFIFSTFVAIIAFVFSAFIGILFGYLPAHRASRLNPIDALRHE